MSALVLAETLDLNAASGLKAAILARRGAPLVIDASGVRRLGGLCLQVLLAAQAAWSADGKPFHLTDASEAFSEAARLFGAQAAFGPATQGA